MPCWEEDGWASPDATLMLLFLVQPWGMQILDGSPGAVCGRAKQSIDMLSHLRFPI